MFILRTDASGRQQAGPKMIKLSSVESLTLGSELACLCFAIPPGWKVIVNYPFQIPMVSVVVYT